MLFLRKPTTETIRAFLEAQGRLDLTYQAVRATATHPPPGYVVDHTRMRLGQGEPVRRFGFAYGTLPDRAGSVPPGPCRSRPADPSRLRRNSLPLAGSGTSGGSSRNCVQPSFGPA